MFLTHIISVKYLEINGYKSKQPNLCFILQFVVNL